MFLEAKNWAELISVFFVFLVIVTLLEAKSNFFKLSIDTLILEGRLGKIKKTIVNKSANNHETEVP